MPTRLKKVVPRLKTTANAVSAARVTATAVTVANAQASHARTALARKLKAT